MNDLELPNKKLFSNTAIRGRVFGSISANDKAPFTPESVQRIGAIWAEFAKKEAGAEQLILGGDPRTSTHMFKAAVACGITSRGVNCAEGGIIPTPAVNWGCKVSNRYGIMITGSHTPPTMNGTKLILPNGFEVDWWSGEQFVEDNFFSNKAFDSIDPLECGQIIPENIIQHYLKYLKDHLKANISGLKIVADVGNGAMTEFIPKFVSENGGTVIPLNNVRDGRFPGRGPEPSLPESIAALAKTVKEEKADLGVAFDGDGDRATFVDENGIQVWGDTTLVLFASKLLKQNEEFVTPVSTASSLVNVASQRYGFKTVWTHVGAAYVARKQYENNALVGGEQNGGIIWMDGVPARDGGRTFIEILNIVAKEGPLGQIIDNALPPVFIDKAKIFLEPSQISKRKEIETAVRRQFKEYKQVTLDGTRLFGGEGEQQWSTLIRFSTTESDVLRVFTDGTDKPLVTKMQNEIVAKTKDILKSL